jgi:hypothetical protein
MIGRVSLALALLVACQDAASPRDPTPATTAVRPGSAAPAAGSAAPRTGGGARGGDNSDAPSVTDAQVSIAVVGAGGATSTFSRAQLEALPPATAPMGDTVTKGQSLLDLARATGLISDAAGSAALWLADGEGASLALPIADLVAGRVVGLLRINRHGELRLKTYEQVGGAWRVRGDLRGLRTITLHTT